MRDIRYVFRKLGRAPLFTFVSILTLALGIGANTAIFSVVNGVLIKPLPFKDPDSLVGVWHTAPGLGFPDVNQSPATYFTYREEGRVFEDMGLWRNEQATVTELQEPERVEILAMTDGVLPLLGVQLALGRSFTREEDSPSGPETVILGNGYWRQRFGGDPQVLGKSIKVNGVSRQVIGVLPAGFQLLRYSPDLVLPLRFDRSKVVTGNFSYIGVARLKPGVTLQEANADVARLIPVTVERFPGGLTLGMIKEAQFGPNLRSLKKDAVGDVGGVLWILLGTVGIVLLIACANVANLFLVRADGRYLELAIRSALGADRWRVARELLTESVILGVLGGVGGLLLAKGGISLLLAIKPDGLPRLEEISIDSTVLLFTLGVSLLAGLLFGLIPVWKYVREDVLSALRDGTRGGSAGRSRQRARSALAVSQITLALVLLVGSGLMIRSFQELGKVDPGFSKPEEVMTLRISVPQAEVADEEQAVRQHEQILAKIQQIPGVASAGISSSLTMDGNDSNDAVYAEDFPVPKDQLPPIRRFKWIAPGYFETMMNPLLAGRSITWDDVLNHRPVVVITENLAREYWKAPQAALGKRIRENPEGAWREIVGVVGDVRDDGLVKPATPVVYWPMLIADFWDSKLFSQRTMSYAIRSGRRGTTGFLDEVRNAVWSVNPNLPLANVRGLEELLVDSKARTSFTLVMLGIAASVALLLGVVGIYGVISYGVTQRTREIGIRMALGADLGAVRRLVLRQGVLLTTLGVGLGLTCAFFLTRLMSSLLFGVNPTDPVTYAAVALLLASIALLACYLPARRASRVSPTEALRWE